MSTNTTAKYPLVYKEPPTIRLAICYNPFDIHDIAKHELVYDETKTLVEYLEGLPEEISWAVAYNGEPVEAEQWSEIKPAVGSTITILRLPEGGNTGKTILRLVALIAVVAFAAPFLGAALANSALTAALPGTLAAQTAAFTTAFSIAGAAIVSALLPAQQINPNQGPVSSNYAISGPKNTAKEGVPVPIVYGQYRVAGNLIDVYTRNIGDDQYLFMRSVLNDGPVSSIDKVWINGQDINEFKDVEYRINYGTSSDIPVSWFSEAIRLFNVQQKIDQTGVLYTTSGSVDRIRVDVSFPLGCIAIIQNSGNRYANGTTLAIDYRACDGSGNPTGSWSPLPLEAELPLDTSGQSGIYTVTQARAASFTVQPATPTSGHTWSVTAQYKKSTDTTWTTIGTRTGTDVLNAIFNNGFASTQTIPPIQWNISFPGFSDWEVQFIGGAVLDNTQNNPRYNVSTQDNVPGTVNNLTVSRKTQSPFNLTYQSSTLTRGQYQIRVKRSDLENPDLNKPTQCWVTDVGEIDNENVTYSGVAMFSAKIRLSDQISSIPNITALVTGSVMTVYDDDGNPTTGVYSNNPADIALDILLDSQKGNLPASHVNFSQFGEWRDFCTANNLTFNGVFDFVTTMWDALQSVARVGHAVVVPVGTTYTPIIDLAADPVQLFNGSNMYMDTFRKSWTSMDTRANEIQQTYYDAADGYKQKMIRLPDVAAQSRQGMTKPASVSGFGITTIAQATAEAEFQARHNAYTTNTISFDAPIESIGLSVGDVALVQHDSVDYAEGVGGRTDVDSTASVINLDRPITMTAGHSYTILITTDALQVETCNVVSKNGNKVVVTGLPSSGLPRIRRIKQGTYDREVIKVVQLNASQYSLTLDDATVINTGAATLWDTDVIVETPVVFQAGTFNSVTLQTPLSGAPKSYSPFLFGQQVSVKMPYRLTSLSGGDDLFRRTLNFVNYDSRIYQPGSWGVPIITPTTTVVIGQVTQLHASWDQHPAPDQQRIGVQLDWRRAQDGATYGGADIYVQQNDGSWKVGGTVQNVTTWSDEENRNALLLYKVVAFDTEGNRAPFDLAPTLSVNLTILDTSVDVPTNFLATTTAFDVTATIHASWTPPTTATPQAYQVGLAALSLGDYTAFVNANGNSANYPTAVTTDANYQIVATTADAKVDIQNLVVATYALRVRAVLGYTVSPWVYLPLQVSAPTIPALVTNLALTNAYPANSTTFATTDAVFGWDDVLTQQAAQTGNAAQNLANYFQDYKVIVEDTSGNPIRTEYTSSPSYTYSLAKNQADTNIAGTVARRSFKLAVAIRGKQGQMSAASTITVNNPAPAAPANGGTIITTAGSTTLQYTAPTDTDFRGVIVYMSQTSGFTPSSANAVYQGYGAATFQTSDNVKYYYRYAFYDSFGTDSLNVSAEYNFTAGIANLAGYAVPTIPTGLTATSALQYAVDGTPTAVVTATWTASTGLGLAGYNVAISTNGGNEIVNLTAGTRYSFNVVPGTPYTVRVAAYSDLQAVSSYTSLFSGTAATDTTVPSAPTAITATASLTSIFLNWTNPTGYVNAVQIYENTSNTTTGATLIATVNAVAGAAGGFTRSGLTSGATRYYFLKAVTTSGVTSAFSTVASATTAYVGLSDLGASAASIPTGLALASSVSVDAVTGFPVTSLTATWTASTGSVVGYELKLTQGAVSTIVAANGLSYTFNPVQSNTSYTVAIRSVDSLGNRSAFSTGVTLTSAQQTTPPAVPTGLSVLAGLQSLWLSWTNASTSDLDRVEVWTNSTNNSATATRIATLNAAPGIQGGYTQSGLASGQTVYYWLKSVNTSGVTSGFSAVASGTTNTVASSDVSSTVAAGVPTGLSTSSALTIDSLTGIPSVSLTASWTASTGSPASYEVQLTQGSIVTVTAVNGTSYTWSPVAANTSYTVAVRAVDRLGNRTAYTTGSTITSTKQSTAPAVPTSPAVLAGVKTLFLSWTNASDVDLGRVEVWTNSTNNSATATRVTTLNANPSAPGTYTQSGLTTGQTVYYWLKSVNTSGVTSGFSAVASGTTATVATTDFATGIQPVSVVATLPSATGYSGPSVVFNQADGQVYRYSGGAWTAAVPTANLSGTISGVQIGSNTITAANIAANTITASQIAANTITASQIAANTITAGQIAAGTITATQIAANTITASQIAANTITASQIAANTITASQIAAGTITGTQISTSTSLPGTITVGATGVSIGTIQTQAADPGSVINGAATLIQPGKILLSGSTALSSWLNGTDATKIDGGSIYTNTINANSLKIGSRGVTIAGLYFSAASGNILNWTAGTFAYTNDAGSSVTVAVSSGSVTWTTGIVYVYWVKDGTTLSTTTTWATANGANNIVIASYGGGLSYIATYGGTIIDGSQITTGSITATQIAANTITASQIAAGTITATQIAAGTITGSQISTSTSLPGTITVGATGVSIATIQTQAADPGTIINGAATLIQPGKILLSGTTSLSSWLNGTDQTKIDGGKIYTNTIAANSLQIGARGLTVSGINFSASGNTLSWTAGTIGYTNDAGSAVTASISSGSATWTSGTVYIYWTKDGTTLSNTTTFATANAANTVALATYLGGLSFIANFGGTIINGATIVTGSITSTQIAAGTITASNIAAGTITSDRIQAGTITGDRFATNTSLPATITVGATGVTIGTVQSQAAAPAATINAGSTTINPGNILISGSTTLANWRNGTDTTKIEGGSIYANTINANSLKIGSRAISAVGIQFTPSVASNVLSWSAGYILYIDDTGASASVAITAGSTTGTNPFCYVYWVKGATTFSVTTTWGTAILGDNVLIATYAGGASYSANYGGTIIDGTSIVTGTITASQIAANTITASQIAAGTITATQIAASTITASNIAAGTISADKLAVGSSANMLYGADGGVWPGSYLLRQDGSGVSYLIGTNPQTGSAATNGAPPRALDAHGTNWSPADGCVVSLYQTGAGSTGTAYWNFFKRSASGNTSYYPIQAGKTYELSMFMQTSGTGTGFMLLRFVDRSGTNLQDTYATATTPGNAGYGMDLSTYTRVGARAVAPANAAYAVLYVMRNNSAVNEWVMFAHPMFCECPANATTFTPWTPSGQTFIDGTGIAASSISASQISVTNLSAISSNLGAITGGSININGNFVVDGSGNVTIQNAASGARLTITNSVLQVYDSSGVLRVRLGLW